MTDDFEDFDIRPGKVKNRTTSGRRAHSFVSLVMRAASQAGFGSAARTRSISQRPSTFGRGRGAALRTSLRSPSRRVVIKTRIVRQAGKGFAGAPLARHITYLEREGVTRDGHDAAMFDAKRDDADVQGFATRCAGDRHHFRFMVSPEDAAQMEDLKAFTRELMSDMANDLGTALDWVAVDHWNTDNPHIHILLRGRDDKGHNLVIARDYVAHGLRGRAEERVSLELGPRSEREISADLSRQVEADRWTGLDRTLGQLGDEISGIIDLRPGGNALDPELNRALIGRSMKLEGMGLATPHGPARWSFVPEFEETLRDLSIRGDIIKTMHRAMSRGPSAPDVSRFAIDASDDAENPVLGRLVARGLHDELRGNAYAIVDGVDGRTHYLTFDTLELTSDANTGAVVELRNWENDKGYVNRTLSVRSDLSLAQQVGSRGATWLDRQLIAADRGNLSEGGFGGEVSKAMDARTETLVEAGLAKRKGQQIIFARNLLDTLKARDLDAAIDRISQDTGLTHRPTDTGNYVAGTYTKRLTLASGRFAMISDGVGFELVPWRPALEQKLGLQVSGTMMPGRGVDWSFGKDRGLGL